MTEQKNQSESKNQTVKKPVKKFSKGTNDYITAWGNHRLVNDILKMMLVVCLLVICVLAGTTAYLAVKTSEVKPLPVLIDPYNGWAKPQKWEIVDASGDARIPNEIRRFCQDFAETLYTYNKFTVESNLAKVIGLCDPQVAIIIRRYIEETGVPEVVSRGGQGLCRVQTVVIQNNLPDLRVQIYFTKEVHRGEIVEVKKTSHVAVMRIKTILRTFDNAHGMQVVEYRETEDNRVKDLDQEQGENKE
jgi:hypothetical protein